MKTLIYIGGFYHLAFAGFHILFWKLFGWKKDLSSLSEINRAVMQILNTRLIYVFLTAAFLSFFYAESLLSSSLGRIVLLAVGLFWLMRAIEQFVFFGIKNSASNALFICFLVGAGIYFYPLIF